MKMKYLLDTVIIIDHLNGIKQATEWLSRLKEGEGAISVITRAEVLVGIDGPEKPHILLFLDMYPCLGINQETADKTAELRKQYKWKLPDAFQAGLAVINKLILVTRNTKDFKTDVHDFVLIPYMI